MQRLLKLRKMSVDEIRVRIAKSLRRRKESRLYHRASGNSAVEAEGKYDVRSLRDTAAKLVPGVRREELDRLQRDFPDTYASLATRGASTAKAVLSGSWQLLGHSVDLRREIDWHRDPRSGHRWPRTFYADVPLGFDADHRVDVKYVWELGRQQYLVELARGWLFTRDNRYAERARELMLSWIRSNPLYEGVHWTSALEVAARAISWLWTVATLADWEGWRAGDMEQTAASLADHATYLEHHFSFYSSPYNHLIGEATGLYLIGLALNPWDEARRWRRVAREVLREHGPRQFYGDGFCVEQATGYHFFTLGFLSMAVSAARTEGSPLRELEQVVHRAYRAGAVLRQPDGRWPAVGDVDSARSIPVHHEDFWDFTSLCSLGAALFNDPELKVSATRPGEEHYWLLGCQGVESWHGLADGCSSTCAVLEESGYAVARRGDDWLLFDAGPLGDGLHPDATPSTAHGHADALQVLFFAGGKQVLLDPGMPFYFGSSDWVEHFRNAAAHNTLEIEGVSMARTAGRLEWSHVAERPRLDANLSDEVWLARGRARWGPGVVVERNLLGLPSRGLWIADWIETDRPRRVRWFWQLPAGTVRHAAHDGPARCLVEGDDLVLATWSDTVPIRARIESASENSPTAWNAPGYGTLSAGQRVCCETEAGSRFLVMTYIGPSPVPVQVSVRGQRLLCTTTYEDESCLTVRDQLTSDISAAKIFWHVRTEQALRTYAAGAFVSPIDSDWSFLAGTGSWSVAVRSRVLTPVN